MSELLSITTICQSMPRELVTTYSNAILSDREELNVYVVSSLSQVAMEKPKLMKTCLQMIETLFKRRNIKVSISNQLKNKMRLIDESCGASSGYVQG